MARCEVLMKSFLLVLAAVAAQSVLGVQYTSKSCAESDFLRFTWHELVRQEPRLGSFLEEIGKASGDPGPEVTVTNCRVTWPVDEWDRPIDGMRTVIIDKVWFPPGKSSEMSQAGMKIFYERRSKFTKDASGNHCTHYQRAIQGVILCRAPHVCRNVGIPFSDPREMIDAPHVEVIPRGEGLRRPPVVTEKVTSGH